MVAQGDLARGRESDILANAQNDPLLSSLSESCHVKSTPYYLSTLRAAMCRSEIDRVVTAAVDTASRKKDDALNYSPN